MMMFYKDFDVLKNEKFDGMIITGAPIEHLEFEDVGYWDEITRVSSGQTRTLQVLCTFVGLRKQDFTIIMASPNINCLRRSSACSANFHLLRKFRCSADSTTLSICHTAATQRYDAKT